MLLSFLTGLISSPDGPTVTVEETGALGVGTALGYSVLGMAIVFAVLVILMFVIKLVEQFTARKQAEAEPTPVSAVPVAAPTISGPAPAKPAPGSAGQLKLYNVEERDAAMIMAIVADSLGKPINELRFISIREVTDQ